METRQRAAAKANSKASGKQASVQDSVIIHSSREQVQDCAISRTGGLIRSQNRSVETLRCNSIADNLGGIREPSRAAEENIEPLNITRSSS